MDVVCPPVKRPPAAAGLAGPDRLASFKSLELRVMAWACPAVRGPLERLRFRPCFKDGSVFSYAM
jgi:hypothetical protein